MFAKLDDERFHLLAFGQRAELPPDAGDLVRVWSVPSDPANENALARAGIPQRSFYLLRPDGHVGLAGTRLDPDQIRGYLAERVACREPVLRQARRALARESRVSKWTDAEGAPRGGTPGAAPKITLANVPPILASPPASNLMAFSGNVLTIPD